MRQVFCILLFSILCLRGFSQSFEVRDKDTINRIDALGRKQGTWREYYISGALKRETYYKDGLKSGLDLLFRQVPNCIKEETMYNKDTIEGVRVRYNWHCKVQFEESYKHGEWDGYVRRYYPSGTVAEEGYYAKGKLVGVKAEYTVHGKVKGGVNQKVRDVNLDLFVNGEMTIRDSIIIKTLNRIKLDKSTTIVADVTGSMYPYIGQLLFWYKMQLDKTPVRQFAFFNDGDDKPDILKRLGKTGGIYTTDTRRVSELEKVMTSAIINGDGGDLPENDLEAILKAINTYKTDEVILVADCTSPIKDMALLKNITVPVSVILCGDPIRMHPDYLTLAHKTHGTLYTLDEQFKNVYNIKEGETLAIVGMVYKYKSGRFRKLVPNGTKARM
jgi:hypothetical protein